MYCFTLGFVYTKKVGTLKQAQKEDRERRLEHRRALVDKENQLVAEDPQGGIANDGPTHDVCTQTSDSELCDIGTTNSDQHDAISPRTNGQLALLQQPLQVNNMSMVCYVPVKSQSPRHPRFGCAKKMMMLQSSTPTYLPGLCSSSFFPI